MISLKQQLEKSLIDAKHALAQQAERLQQEAKQKLEDQEKRLELEREEMEDAMAQEVEEVERYRIS